MNHPAMDQAQRTAHTLTTWLQEADRVLLAAGAGLSAAAGYDYGDTARFAELFPALHAHGLRARYQLIGAPLPEPLLWGYWATHVADIRFAPGPNPLYQQVRALVGEHDHFVMTSNVDALFTRNGFDPDRVWTPQGDYGRYQCDTPCTRTTWASRPIIETALAAYDPATGQVTDPAALPRCPGCGGTVFLNVHKGPEYISDPYQPQRHALLAWLKSATPSTRTLIIEIGAGFNTPGVIRRPVEHLTRTDPRTRLIRINPDHPDIPADLAQRGLSVALGARQVLDLATRSH